MPDAVMVPRAIVGRAIAWMDAARLNNPTAKSLNEAAQIIGELQAAPPPPSVSIDNGSLQRQGASVPTEQAEPAVVDDGGWIVAPDGGWKTNPVPGLAVYIREDDWESVTSSTNWDWRDVTAYRIAPQPADGCSSNEGADGWIEHDGGPNPVPGQRVDVRWRDGEVSTDEPSRDWCWKPTDGDDTIIAYRIAGSAHD